MLTAAHDDAAGALFARRRDRAGAGGRRRVVRRGERDELGEAGVVGPVSSHGW